MNMRKYNETNGRIAILCENIFGRKFNPIYAEEENAIDAIEENQLRLERFIMEQQQCP